MGAKNLNMIGTKEQLKYENVGWVFPFSFFFLGQGFVSLLSNQKYDPVFGGALLLS